MAGTAGPRRAEASAGADGDEFAARVEAYRRDVVLLCYRLLGSIAEAEEAAQETAIRAWRGRHGYRGDASLRTWLHRIATRVCIDTLGRRRRSLPTALGPPADPVGPPAAPVDVPWLEPLPGPVPDEPIAPGGADPAVRYSTRESVSLAFAAALQALPPRQRAVLILRDVLGWSASETAATLEVTVPSVTSALHRARRTLEAGHHRSGLEAMSVRHPDDPSVRRLVDRYVAAWEADDVDALVATLRDDARLAMPPSPAWYRGPAAIGALLRRWVFGAGPAGRFEAQRTTANGGPGVVFRDVVGGGRGSGGVQVLTVERDGIVDVVVYLDPVIAARFAPAG